MAMFLDELKYEPHDFLARWMFLYVWQDTSLPQWNPSRASLCIPASRALIGPVPFLCSIIGDSTQLKEDTRNYCNILSEIHYHFA